MAHILVVEDDDVIRKMLRKWLERAGYSVSEAWNGKVCIQKYREKPADLVIMDIIMPEMDGIETIIWLKKEFGAVKIIAISGGGAKGPDYYIDLAKMFGVTDAFAKPLRKSEFLSSIEKALS